MAEEKEDEDDLDLPDLDDPGYYDRFPDGTLRRNAFAICS